jgi:DNA-binding NarL/FixJ family response regulator
VSVGDRSDAGAPGPPSDAVRTIVFGSDPARCAALRSALEASEHVVVRATTSDLETTLLQVSRVAAEVVVLTDGHAGVAETCDRLGRAETPPRTLLVEREGDEQALLHAMEGGVDGYAIDAGVGAGVGECVRALARGESVIPRTMLGPLLRHLIERRRHAEGAAEQLAELTPREREVLRLLADGRDQREIASDLFISPDTARTHIQRVLRKLDVHSRAEAIELVQRTGMADRLERMVERSVP